MTTIALGIGKSVAVGVAALVAQQLVTAGIYGTLAYPIGTPLNVSWMDYVEEYLLWRGRLPMHGMTQTEIVANGLGLAVVVVVAMVLYKGVL